MLKDKKDVFFSYLHFLKLVTDNNNKGYKISIILIFFYYIIH